MREGIVQASNAVDRCCRWAAIAFLACMLILLLFQVVARYLFRSVPVWSEDVARYCMIWGGLLGATAAFRADADPRLINPPKKDNPRWKIISAQWMRGLAAAIFLAPVLYHSYGFLVRNFQRTSESMGVPMGWIVLAVPISVAVIFFHLLAKLAGSGMSKPPNGLEAEEGRGYRPDARG